MPYSDFGSLRTIDTRLLIASVVGSASPIGLNGSSSTGIVASSRRAFPYGLDLTLK